MGEEIFGIKDNEIIYLSDGTIVTDPVIVIDRETGTLLRSGDTKSINLSSFEKAKIPYICIYLKLSGLDIKESTWLMNHVILNTNSACMKDLANACCSCIGDFVKFVQEKMDS